MNNEIKKYVSIVITLALAGAFMSLGSVVASADSETNTSYSLNLDTPDTAETSDTPDTPDIPEEKIESPFTDVDDITKAPLIGDVNGDGRITAVDAVMTMRIAANTKGINGDCYCLADIDGDSRITSLDAFRILRHTVGLNSGMNEDVIVDVSWIKRNDGIYAYYADGTPVNGIKTFEGIKCGFDENGRMYTGNVEIDGKSYHFLDNGVLLTGWQYSEKGKSYYENGVAKKGWTTLYTNTYYFDEDGYALTGWQNIDGNDYYFKPDAVAAKGWTTVNGKMCYFNKDLIMETGFVNIGGDYYYLQQDGGYLTGWYTVNGEKYYFTENGAAARGWTVIFGKTYYFQTETQIATGLYTINNELYYFDKLGVMQTGWQRIDNVKYYFTEDGSAPKEEYTVDNTEYYFENGALYSGWTTLDGKTYYKDDKGFSFKGWQIIDGKRYYFDKNAGFMYVGQHTIDGSSYVFDSNGVMTSGWIEKDGHKSYLSNGKVVTGEFTIDGKKYCFANDGLLYTGLCTLNGNLYYKNDYGFNKTGWQTINGSKYYFNSNGVAAEGFITIDGKLYYFEKGKMFANTSVGLYNIDANGICTRVTTISANQAKYRADEIIASVGKDAYSLYAYVVNHISYYFVNEPQVYNNAQTAEWSRIAAYGMNRGYGACYHFAAYLDVLFKRAGYTSRIVVGTGYYTSLHCWNQIKVNGTWVNYDAVSRLFNVSDAYLSSLSFTFNQYVTATY